MSDRALRLWCAGVALLLVLLAAWAEPGERGDAAQLRVEDARYAATVWTVRTGRRAVLAVGQDAVLPTAVPSLAWIATGYCSGTCCTPGLGITASGARPRMGWTTACPPEIALGSLIRVTWAGGRRIFACQDRGSAIQGKRIDIYWSSHQQAVAWGVRTATVEVLYGR